MLVRVVLMLVLSIDVGVGLGLGVGLVLLLAAAFLLAVVFLAWASAWVLALPLLSMLPLAGGLVAVLIVVADSVDIDAAVDVAVVDDTVDAVHDVVTQQ